MVFVGLPLILEFEVSVGLNELFVFSIAPLSVGLHPKKWYEVLTVVVNVIAVVVALVLFQCAPRTLVVAGLAEAVPPPEGDATAVALK